MSGRLCKYYNTPGGCRRGDACTFQHQENAQQSPKQASASGPARGRVRQGNDIPLSSTDAPPGVCRFYWANGHCAREFQCRFRHVQRDTASPSAVTPPAQQQPASDRFSAIDALAPFLTESGSAKLTGSGTKFRLANTDLDLSPNEAQRHLQRFLKDDYRFGGSLEIYAFLKILSSAATTNSSWTPEDGQLFLSAIASSNALKRINEILEWPSVSLQAGPSRAILSFQRGYFPLLRYYSSSSVVKSTLSHLVNSLYLGIIHNFERFAQVMEESMNQAIATRSFKDHLNTNLKVPPLYQVLLCLSGVLYQCLTRFKNAVATQPKLAPLVKGLQEWMQAWERGVTVVPPEFDDFPRGVPEANRNNLIAHMNREVHRLLAIVNREESKLGQLNRRTPALANQNNGGLIAALRNTYEGPGELREEGKRHDNDFVEIQDIRIAPTNEELTCQVAPFLPANLYDAPHPYPAESMERLLDIQFRLLREELTASLRTAVQLVREDLAKPKREKSRLSKILDDRGGKYRGQPDRQESILFDVYTNVGLLSLVPDQQGITVSISADAPPGRARASQSRMRASYWEGVSGKRLMRGGLVALVWKCASQTDIYLGTVASSPQELSDSAKSHPDRICLRVKFFDTVVMLRTLNHLRHPPSHDRDIKVMLEAPIMFEAIRPFLEALRVEPESLPFAKYLVHRPLGQSVKVEPPRYTVVPGFHYQLSSLFSSEAGVTDLKLSPTNPDSVAAARQILRDSRLDPSQADAVVDALSQELSLIQGPPGTGKSFTGVEIIRVLLANGIRPILMIAFTNHALDHILRSVLDAGITTQIVRMGSRSADETISQYSIDAMERTAGQSRLNNNFSHHYRTLRDVQERFMRLMKQWSDAQVSSEQIENHLQIQYPEHSEHIESPPRWIRLIQQLTMGANDDDGWQRVGKNGRKSDAEDNSYYAFWRDGRDLNFLLSEKEEPSVVQPDNLVTPEKFLHRNKFQALEDHDNYSDPDENESDVEVSTEPWEECWRVSTTSFAPNLTTRKPQAPISLDDDASQGSDALSDSERDSEPIGPSDFKNIHEFLSTHGYEGSSFPSSDRPLDTLLAEGVMWTLSISERKRLHDFWTERVRLDRQANLEEEYSDLCRKHEEALRDYLEGKDEIRRHLLRNVEIVGCTTTGAAKLTSLLKGLSPRVMLIEEAGQVLEAHVLGSLVPSVEHLILIGDPKQLRPTINNFSLSMDHPRGRQLFRFDMSLMERLATCGFPMTQINVQRRMRPMIADLVRNTLYPNLEDHDLVKRYPPVRGLSKNVFFFSHSHKENAGGEETGSKFNLFEVAMVKDLVLYLLRQGCYSQDGDIVVLCAYLGQLAKVRDALSKEVAVVIDERDQAALEDQEGEENKETGVDIGVERIQVSKRVRLRTVDNYQGEEAKIVILSLVRNSGLSDDDADLFAHASAPRVNIGFLKSENRINVALSRAKEGLYLLGNAPNLASRSTMWNSVIEELEKRQAVGDAFPIACHQHSDVIQYVSEPGELPKIAPDGGCLRSCDVKLKCGHLCPYKCHPDDPNHVGVTCVQRCGKLCLRGHPCTKQCEDQCGDCMFPGDINLPCGHLKFRVPCHLWDDPDELRCEAMVNRQIPNCQHTADMQCSADPGEYRCNATCGGVMPCCGRDCRSRCYQCQELSAKNVEEDQVGLRKHYDHPCQKALFCEHQCQSPCSQDHQCTSVCQGRCRQECPHARCKKSCSEPCAPCKEPCTWTCDHFTCPVPCGSICARLPCDRRCSKLLKCGHRCPSICGELCSIQICPVCASPEWKSRVVDLVLYRTLGEVEVGKETLAELLIRIPNCQHVFTVETLDGHCGMQDYYRREGEEGRWLGLKAPSPGFQKPPVCPTCRVAITSPRYGRIFKRADLDILELNVASRLARSFARLNSTLDNISKPDAEVLLRTAATTIEVSPVSTSPKAKASQRKHRKNINRKKRIGPVPADCIDPGNEKLYDVSPFVVKIWRQAAKKFLDAYRQASDIATARSAHSDAWQSAFSCLWRNEMEFSVSDPSQTPRKPEEHAMRMAKMQVGQPQPRADKKYAVEALLLTIQIRFMLVDLNRTWLDAINNTESYAADQKQSWGTFGLFLIESCIQDANLALETARSSEARRQMTRASLLCMRAELERFRYNVEMLNHSGLIKERRTEMADMASQKRHETAKYVRAVFGEHWAIKSGPEEASWLKQNFTDTTYKIIDEWQKLERSLLLATFYVPVSLEEKITVLQILGFAHTGHYYTCPNGHIYVIGECGGAVERSVCNECGAAIGGSSHVLDSTNRRATEFDELARQHGASNRPDWGF